MENESFGFAALLLAAGSGSRLGGEIPKPFLEVEGRPLLQWCAERLAALPGHLGTILTIDPAARSGGLPPLWPALERARVLAVVDGGADRQESCAKAYAALCGAGLSACDLVLVHDAARPFFPRRQALEALSSALRTGAAICAHPVRDTLKRVDPEGRIQETLPRSEIRAAATPQVFRREVFERMQEAIRTRDLRGTDESSLAERLGFEVRCVLGPTTNLKVTYPEDLPLLEPLARETLRHDREET